MLFYEPLFLFGFFPVIFSVYLLLRNFAKGSLGWIALVSAAFYLWAEPKFFFVILASAIFDFCLGKQIAKPSHSAWYLRAGVAANLGLLAIFKYTSFFIAEIVTPTMSLVSGPGLSIPKLALPIGISFIIFEKITYLVDINRKVSPPASTFLDYLFFVLFFPKLLAGPIIKYHEIEPQIRHRPYLDHAFIAAGFERFAIGVCKKVLIADSAGLVSNQIFAAPVTQLGMIDTWVGALLFTVQIYFDFSAYSDMAIGIALMLGLRLRENFNFPYVSVGITEFWRRWHISLSSWIREYLYIPLGGSRVSSSRTYVNLITAFMASGLWHGANWTYLAWGIFHGLFLVLERAFLGRWLQALPTAIGIGFTFLVVVHGWVLFRAPNIGYALEYLGRMYDARASTRSIYVPLTTAAVCVLALLASVTSRGWMTYRLVSFIEEPAVRLALRILLAVLFVYSLGKVLTLSFQPFLYFRF